MLFSYEPNYAPQYSQNGISANFLPLSFLNHQPQQQFNWSISYSQTSFYCCLNFHVFSKSFAKSAIILINAYHPQISSFKMTLPLNFAKILKIFSNWEFHHDLEHLLVFPFSKVITPFHYHLTKIVKSQCLCS